MKRRDVLKLVAASVVAKPAAVLAASAVDTKADVVVIGSGGAGFTAAITAHDLGAKVIVLEKMPITGGNTQLAAGGMNAAGTRYQAALNIKDSWELMRDDTLKGGRNLNVPRFVEILAKNSADGVDWLVSLGADLTGVSRAGGASVDRTHGPKDHGPVGPEIIKTLRSAADQRKIDVRANSHVFRIETNANGAITGVQVRERDKVVYHIDAKVVVLASGGFGANKEMVAKYCSRCEGMATSNQPGATGDGITLAEQVAAQLRDMDQVQVHPSLGAGTNILVSEGVRGAGAILVNRKAQRFVNEIATRDVTSAAVLEQPGKTAFAVFDAGLRNKSRLIEGYAHLNLVKEGATIDALAQVLGIDPAAFATTISNYNKYQKEKNDVDFKRPDMPIAIDEPPFYSIEI